MGAGMSELRVFIADDEAPARDRLKSLLADIAAELPTRVVGEARNGIEVMEAFPGERAHRCCCSTSQCPGMSGLEAARHLARLPGAPAVVFVTAHDEHAVEAFELNALDYLMKPVRASRLAAALRKASLSGAPGLERLERAGKAGREYFSVAERSRIVLVPCAR
jgi:two-component system response regulator AlgR